MASGQLPKAPIFDDITKLTASMLPSKQIDVILAGWPCQDVSAIGKRQGLSGSRSGLIREVFRLVDEIKPNAVFLENVPMLLKNGIDVILKEFVRKRGYRIKWVVKSAASVGAPHLRKRWFGLLFKDGFELPKVRNPPPHQDQYPSAWSREPVPRMVLATDARQTRRINDRLHALGNSVVPHCLKSAFLLLANPTSHGVARSRQSLIVMSSNNAFAYPLWGHAYMNGSRLYIEDLGDLPAPPDRTLRLVLDPNVYTAAEGAIARNTLPRLDRKGTLTIWATPLQSNIRPSNTLTLRSMADLPTQLRFEVSTPARLRPGRVNPSFLEWMMGYPQGWTQV